MAEIIRAGSGVQKSTDTFRSRCNHCDSVVGFLRRAVMLIHDPRDGDYYCLPCPACAKDITIAADRLEQYRWRTSTGEGS